MNDAPDNNVERPGPERGPGGAFDAIGQDGRRVRHSRMIKQGEDITPEMRDEVIERIKSYIERHNISQAQLARMSGLGSSTVSELLSGVYGERKGSWKADALGKLRRLNNCIEVDARRRNIILETPYVETSVAKEIITVARVTNDTCGIGVIFGPARIGKTFTLRHLQGDESLGDPILFRVCQQHTTVNKLGRALCICLKGMAQGKAARPRSADDAFERIVEVLRARRTMLMVDEADRLNHAQLDYLRDIKDEAQCPLLLSGKDAIYDKLGFRYVGERREVMDQLAGRVVIRRDLTERTRRFEESGGPGGKKSVRRKEQPLFTRDDIRKLIQVSNLSFKVTPDAIDWLQQRASTLGLGGLGQVVIHLYLADNFAMVQGFEAITAEILSQVEEQVTYGMEAANDADQAVATYGTAIPKVG